MEMHIQYVALAALIRLVLGFIWYHPKVFGTAWMNATGLNEESMKGANMVVIFGVTYLLSFFAAFGLEFFVVHQWHIYSILENEPSLKDPNSELSLYVKDFMDKHGNNFRSFGHGTLHGTIAGFMMALPVVGVNALFERRGFKYIAINAGFWILCFALMGGVVCAWS